MQKAIDAACESDDFASLQLRNALFPGDKPTTEEFVEKMDENMQELDATILREFIDRIEVSHTDKKSRTREITIVYNFIGAFDFSRALEEAQSLTVKQQRTA